MKKKNTGTITKKLAGWLKLARPLNIRIDTGKESIDSAVDHIFKEIKDVLPKTKKDEHTIKKILKVILLNLWIGNKASEPIRYSRKRNHYFSNQIYGQSFFKYEYVMAIIDSLIKTGYMKHAIGYYEGEYDFGKQSRMWASDQLVKLFLDHDVQPNGKIKRTEPERDEIQLRKKLSKTEKVNVAYKETEFTKKSRANLISYNDKINTSRITIKLKSEDVVSNRMWVEGIHNNLLEGGMEIKNIKEVEPGSIIYNYKEKRKGARTITGTAHKQQYQDSQSENAFFSFLSSLKKSINAHPNRKKRNNLLKKQKPLKDHGISELEIELKDERLYRVFNMKPNNDDNLFAFGGRFYGALHLNMKKELRRALQINGEETAEIDFSGLHIRMLYHTVGIDYDDDPYMVGTEEERELFKIVALISINAEEKKAARAIFKHLKKARIKYNKKIKAPIKSRMNRFKQKHAPIADYLFSGIGLELQNKDSLIMDKILTELSGRGIVGLPVHDSVIVAKQHENLLREIMIQAYMEEMGFQPEIKKAA